MEKSYGDPFSKRLDYKVALGHGLFQRVLVNTGRKIYPVEEVELKLKYQFG